MAKLAAAYPNDTEASIFYALSIAAAASPTDKTFADQLKAGAILEKLITKQPDHPGLAHYIIHSYDVPPLADRALAAARRYAKIAPSAPHALHMPSHTFTRLGYWQESIDTNIASGDGREARGLGRGRTARDGLPGLRLPADGAGPARASSCSTRSPKWRHDSIPSAIGSAAPGSAGVFALAAIPARYALERGEWAEAAKLEPHSSKFPYTEALTYFARALGAARVGDTATIRSSIDELQRIQQRLTDAHEVFWAGQADIQRRSALAWLAFAEHRQADALKEMRAAPGSKTEPRSRRSRPDRWRLRASCSEKCSWRSNSRRRRARSSRRR